MVFMGNSFAFVAYTGLHVEFDRILEIACIVTDGSLTKSIEVIYPYCLTAVLQKWWLLSYVFIPFYVSLWICYPFGTFCSSWSKVDS